MLNLQTVVVQTELLECMLKRIVERVLAKNMLVLAWQKKYLMLIFFDFLTAVPGVSTLNKSF